jgi:hypothetical protein
MSTNTTIEFINSSFLRQQPKAIADQPNSDTWTIAKGTTVGVKAHKRETGLFLRVTFDRNFNGRNTWLVYEPDIKIHGATNAVKTLNQSAKILLSVPFWNQVDNRFEPMRTCNTSACAMAAKFLGAKISGDDEYYLSVIRYGDTTDHTAQTRALMAIGICSTWHTDLDFADLDRELEAGRPLVLGVLHRGSLDAPTGGHMVVCIGRTAEGDYIFHDPFGSLLDAGGGYTGDVSNGRNVIYPRSVLQRRWLPEGARSGWGRTLQ